MSDDLAQAMPPAPASGPVPLDEPEPPAGPYVQMTEITATPVEASDAIDRRDAYGRVPVVIRIRRQPPIRIEAVLVAVALGASGVLLPVFEALKAVIIVGAVVALVIGFMARLFIRVPPGSIGLVMRGGRHSGVLEAGIHRVSPFVALTHLITTREIAFDVPVNEARSADGVGISIDLMLSLQIADPVKFAYGVSTGDADQLVHAATQDAARRLARSTEAMAALDLGDEQAAVVRGVIDAGLDAYGIDVRHVAFTRVSLPVQFTDSLEARRLAVVQLAEQGEAYELEKRRLADHASLVAQEAEARRAAVALDALAEELRLAKLEERLTANPHAARYDLEQARIRVAEQLAGNSRAVVSLGGSDLVNGLLTAREAAEVPVAKPAAASPARTPRP
ncbi:MAG TPA: SPFH domain-containing protein [Candidatus Limnocylindrales bacterium]|nr:SPFH domain-containing protein [Candidatus Limnocylindrales bacterium]